MLQCRYTLKALNSVTVTTVVIGGRYGYRISEGIAVMLLNYKAIVGVEAFTAVAVKSTVFWDAEFTQVSEGHLLHLHGRRYITPATSSVLQKHTSSLCNQPRVGSEMRLEI